MQYVVILTIEGKELFLMDAYKNEVRIFERRDLAEEVATALDGYVLDVADSDPAAEN